MHTKYNTSRSHIYIIIFTQYVTSLFYSIILPMFYLDFIILSQWYKYIQGTYYIITYTHYLEIL